ncbi:hypothetical protein [Acidithiobacillus thiooxidans]|uniref:hypothetical protein n=1 Tax=Acidithiobacillus thiooxidans TaxID=930 RepID=UPI001FD3788D|nr:hypothetical protein [Acidithiobacillus thiooxidans]
MAAVEEWIFSSEIHQFFYGAAHPYIRRHSRHTFTEQQETRAEQESPCGYIKYFVEGEHGCLMRNVVDDVDIA